MLLGDSFDAMSRPPATQYSIHLEVTLDNGPGVLGRLATAIGDAGGNIYAVDSFVAKGELLDRAMVVNCQSVENQAEVVAAVENTQGVVLRGWWDRTFKMHEGGKIEVLSLHPVGDHEDLSMAYTPGVAAEINTAVLCSKGTYIRALAEDLGTALNLPAHVKTLRRTQAGPFGLAKAVTLSQLEAAVEAGSEDRLDALLLPVDASLDHLPSVLLSEAATFYVRKGQTVVVPNAPRSGMVRIADAGGVFLGVGKVQEDGTIAPVRLLAQ